MSHGPESAFTRWLRKYRYVNIALIYLGTALVVIHFAEAVVHGLHMPAITFSLIVVLALAGLPIVLLIAWALGHKKGELTGENIPVRSKKRNPAKIIIASAFSLALFAAAIFVYNKYFYQSKFTGKEKSIAVLPFTNMSSDKENEYFSDGITEEITTQLSKIGELKVIARKSAMVFKASKKSIKEIADELNVASVLEGSVRKTGDQIRITAQLIDANTQENIWAENYDREFKDVFTIQSEVAEKIAHQLNAKLTAEEKKTIEKNPTSSPEAYRLYLQGNQLYKLFLATSFKISFFETSKSFFEKAISIDPQFALAHAALANLYNTYTTYVREDSVMLTQQLKEIQTAWEIDSTNDDILTIRGIIETSQARDTKKGFQYSKKALEVNQNNPGTLLNLIFITGDYLGLHDEAKLLAERLVSIDPLSAVSFKVRGHCNFLLNRPQEAAKDLEAALRLQPDMTTAIDQLGAVYAQLGRNDDAKKLLEKSLQQRPNLSEHNAFNLAYGYAKLGNAEKALQLAPKDFPILLILGKAKEAIKALPNHDDAYTPYLIYNAFLNTAEFAGVRNDADFLRAMERYKIKYEENKREYGVSQFLK